MANDHLQLVVQDGVRKDKGIICVALNPLKFRESGIEPLTTAIILNGAMLLGSELERLQDMFDGELDISSRTCVALGRKPTVCGKIAYGETIYRGLVIRVLEKWAWSPSSKPRPIMGPRLRNAIARIVNAPILRYDVTPDQLEKVSREVTRSSLRSPI